MDLIHLIHRESEERLSACQAASDQARDAHLALADLYRDRIEFRRRTVTGEAGADPAPFAA